MTDLYYDDYDIFWCRDFVPLSEALQKLHDDGNRYHLVFALRLAQAQANRWLIKPAAGFVNQEHADFFNASWRTNSFNIVGAFASYGVQGFADRPVFDKGVKIADSAQPYAGWMLGAKDKSRINFEKWHLSGASLRSAYDVQGVVAKVAWCDKAWALDKSDASKARLQLKCPGWRPEDGSSPALGISGPLA